MMKKLIVGGLIAGAAAFGLNAGAGSAEAKIEPGTYTQQTVMYGLIPFPQSTVQVTKNNRINARGWLGSSASQRFVPTKQGGTTVDGFGTPIEQWFGRIEYRKAPAGYKGTMYIYGGIAVADVYMKKGPPRQGR